jgi:predicted Zn-dependent protease
MADGASLIFLEQLRERYPTAIDKDDLEERIVAHEVGHALTLNHGDNTDSPANNGIMNKSLQSAPTAQMRFIDEHLDVLRKLSAPSN